MSEDIAAMPELGDAVLATEVVRGKARVDVQPSAIGAVLEHFRAEGFTSLMSVHGLDYYPEEPRLGVQYELLNRTALQRMTVRLRVPLDAPNVPSVSNEWPTANHQEREVFDMFGVVFDGHPDLRRILMPDDYVGFPQRRDFPIGGEPVIFTFNEGAGTAYTAKPEKTEA